MTPPHWEILNFQKCQEKIKSKAARYAEYKPLEEEKLLDGVKKLISLIKLKIVFKCQETHK